MLLLVVVLNRFSFSCFGFMVYFTDKFIFFICFQFADIGERLGSCNGFVRCSNSQF